MGSKIISIKEAIEMKKQYLNTIAPLIETNKGNGYQATDFAWIDLASLKDYLALLDDVMKKNDKEISGIRIYFSAYPNSDTFASTGNPIDFKGRETVLLAPTIEVDPTTLSGQYPNLENLPFFIEPTDDSKPLVGDFVVIEDLLNASDNRPSNLGSSGTNSTSLIMDNMSLTPPPPK